MPSPPLYQEHAPCPALRAHIACYWTMAGELARTHRVLPDGCMDFLFEFAGSRGPAATLVGTMSAPLDVPAGGRADFLGVRFRPGEAFAFIGAATAGATDKVLPLADAIGGLAEAMWDELASQSGTAARLAVLDRRLYQLRERARPADRRVRLAVERIRSAPGEARVGQLALDLGLGERQLERIFAERVGIGPKAFARIARLQSLIRGLAEAGERPSWADLASARGYADQAHMIREVKRLAGATPTELARLHAAAMSDSFNPRTEPRGKKGI